MDLISEKYNKLDLLIERIGDAESLADTEEIAVELYKTLGFCHGFLGKKVMQFPDWDSEAFPWDREVWKEAYAVYDQEWLFGKGLRKGMEENESI